jgi:molybdenum cofactor guanylyltransferase
MATCQVVFISKAKNFLKKPEKLTEVLFAIQIDEPTEEQNAFLKEKNIEIISYDNFERIVLKVSEKIASNIAPIKGLLLAGGKSSRMGQDKGEINYFGLTQREYAAKLLKGYVQESYLSLNATQAAAYQGDFPIIADQFLGIGPLGGILSAFKAFPNHAWLVLACDMPFVTEATLNYLCNFRNPQSVATCFASEFDGFPEPLCTIFEPKAYPVLLEMLAYGYDCPRKALINFDTTILSHPNSTELSNINTPEQLTEAFIKLNPRFT